MKQERLFNSDPPKIETIDGRRVRKHNPGQLKLLPTKQMIKEAAQEKARLHRIERLKMYRIDSLASIDEGTWPRNEWKNDTFWVDERNPYIVCWAIKQCVDNSATAQWDSIINFLMTWYPYAEQTLRWGLGGSFRACQKYGYIEHVRPKTWRLRPAGYELLKEIGL